MARRICRKSSGLHGLSQGIPFQLLIVIKIFPFVYTSLMDGELHLLASCTGEDWIRFGLEITFSVNMEECDVSDRGIAVRKEEAWFVFRHSLEV
jgi:hypothetical protein